MTYPQSDWQTFIAALGSLEQEVIDYNNPKDTVSVALGFNYDSLKEILRSENPSKGIYLLSLTDGSRDVENLYGLNDFLRSGTVIVKPEGDQFRIERIGEWQSNGIEYLDELFQQTQCAKTIDELKAKCGEQSEQAFYGLRTANEGFVYVHKEGSTLFFPESFPIEGKDKRVWTRGELFHPAFPLFLVKDEDLIGRVNATYDAVDEKYVQIGERCVLRIEE